MNRPVASRGRKSRPRARHSLKIFWTSASVTSLRFQFRAAIDPIHDRSIVFASGTDFYFKYKRSRTLGFFVSAPLFFFAPLVSTSQVDCPSRLPCGAVPVPSAVSNLSLHPPTSISVCPLHSSVVKAEFMLPPCNVSRVCRHAPCTSVPPPRSSPSIPESSPMSS